VHKKEIKCCILLFVFAGITAALVYFCAWAFVEYFPLNIYLVLVIFGCDCIISGYYIVKTSKEVREDDRRIRNLVVK